MKRIILIWLLFLVWQFSLPSGTSVYAALAADQSDPIFKKPNFYKSLDSQYLNCWPASRMPIPVYVYPADGVRNFRPAFIQILKSACSEWTEASNGAITFRFVDKLPEY